MKTGALGKGFCPAESTAFVVGAACAIKRATSDTALAAWDRQNQLAEEAARRRSKYRRPSSATARYASQVWVARDADRHQLKKAALAAAEQAMLAKARPVSASCSAASRARRPNPRSNFRPSAFLQSASCAGLAPPPVTMCSRRSAQREGAIASALEWQGSNRKSSKPRWTKEESELLGASVAFLCGSGNNTFLAEVEHKCGRGADVDYYELSARMCRGSQARGVGLRCPRDGLRGCSYVDALEGANADRANMMLSWTWSYTVRTVVGSLQHWCTTRGQDLTTTYLWQDALCCNQIRFEEQCANGIVGDSDKVDLDISILRQRMRDIGSVLVLLSPWRSPTYLGRAWCLFELWLGASTDCVELHVSLDEWHELHVCDSFGTGDLQATWSALEGINIQRASASIEEDRNRIVDALARECHEGNLSEVVARVNHGIIRRLRGWLVDLTANRLERHMAAEQVPFSSACLEAAWLLRESSDIARTTSLRDALGLALEAAEAENVSAAQSADLRRSRAIWLLVQQDWESAEASLEEARSWYEDAGLTESDEYATVLRDIGRCLHEQAHYEDALEVFRLAKSTSESAGLGQSLGHALLLKHIGTTYDKMDHWDEAMDMYLASEEVFEGLGPTMEKARLLKSMGELLQDNHKYKKAANRFEAAKLVYESIGVSDSCGYAPVLKYLGIWHREQGELERAMQLLKASQWFHKDSGQTVSISYAAVLKSMGTCERHAGRYTEAIRAFEEAKVVYNAISAGRTTGDQIELMMNMASCFHDQGKLTAAMAHYEEAKRAHKAIGEDWTRDHAWLLSLIGACLCEQQHYDEAKTTFDAAESIYNALSLRGRRDHSLLLKNKGICYRDMVMYNEAMAAFEDAKHAYEHVGAVHSNEYASLLQEMGTCSYNRGHLDEAAQLFAAADRICQAQEHRDWRMCCWLQKVMGVCYEKQGKPGEAKEILERAFSTANESRIIGKAQDDRLISELQGLLSALN